MKFKESVKNIIEFTIAYLIAKMIVDFLIAIHNFI